MPRKRLAPWAGNLLLVAASLAFLTFVVGILELGLRAVGLGDPDPARTSRLGYQQLRLPVLEPGTRPDGTRVLMAADPRLPYQTLLLDKPANALRVIVFGGSAAAGLGFSPNVTFARHLERMLRRAAPDRALEVLNLGVVGFASGQVERMVADACARYAPDVVVVYAGNNEFLEIHAEKYARVHTSALSRWAESALETNLYRFVRRALRGPPRPPSLAHLKLSREEERLTQRAIVREIEMEPGEVDTIVDAYAANLERMVDAALTAESTIVLMTVASNWRWRGREDLPENWLAELLGGAPAREPETYRRARSELDRRIAASSIRERSEWYFRRAVVNERLGALELAARDYRTALNEDPHLRRALDAMNERVRSLSRRRGVPLVDTVEILARATTDGIIGFAEFYDYVHFMPRGALLVAEAIFRELTRIGLVAPEASFDATAYVEARLRQLRELGADPLDVGEWMGLGFDLSRLRDRDLWKYDRVRSELDRRIDENPDDPRALGYRGNAHYFDVDGAARAERDYRAALALAPERSEIRANLERLLAERGP